MRKSLFALSLLLLTACGVQLGDPKPPTSSQSQAATQMTNSIDQIGQLQSKPENAFSIYAMLAALGTQAVDWQSKGKVGPTSEVVMPTTLPAGCVTGDAASGYHYNNCTSGGTTINGTVQSSGGTTSIDMTISASGSGSSIKITMSGSVTDDGSHIGGQMAYEYKVDLGPLGGLVGAAGANQKTTVKYDATYTKNPACISGGSIRVDVEGALSGAAQFEWTGCNMFTVRNG